MLKKSPPIIWAVNSISGASEIYRSSFEAPVFSSTGTLPGLRHWMSVSNLKDDVVKPFDITINQAMDAAEALYLKAQTFFEDLTDLARIKQGNRRSSYTEKVRYKPGETLFQETQRQPPALCRSHRQTRRQPQWLVRLAQKPERRCISKPG